MEKLEQTVEKSFLGKVKNNLRRVRDSVAGKVTVYSLAGVLSAGLGYGCGEDKTIAPKNDVLENYETEVYQGDSGNGEVKSICWDKTYGGSGWDTANSIQQTTDGGYIVAGWTKSKGVGGDDVWILKLKPNGELEWDKTFGGSDDDWASSIQQTTDGGYIVAGYTYSKGAGSGDAWVLKLDSNGDLKWDKTFGGSKWDEVHSIQQTNDGRYIVAGQRDRTEHFWSGDAWVLKLDPNGNLEWDKTFGGSEYDEAHSIQQTKDGGYVVAGVTHSKGAGFEYAWILKLDASGNLEWDKTYGEGGDYDIPDEAHSIQQTSDGGYVVAGKIVSKGAGGYDAWVLKLNSNGNLEWDKTFGGSDFDEAYSIQQTTDLGYIVAGGTQSKGAGSLDAWILKLKPNGDLQWDKTFGGYKPDEVYSIRQTKEGGYIAAGETDSKGAGWYDAWVLKLDKDGNLECK